MPNLKYRLKKAEESTIIKPERITRLFFRERKDRPSEAEIKFRRETKDLKNYQIYVMYWDDPNAIKFDSPEDEARMLSEEG